MYVSLQFTRDWMCMITGRMFRAGRVYPNQPEGVANVLVRRGIATRVEQDAPLQPPAKRRPKR